MTRDKHTYIYDIETGPNYFLLCAVDLNDNWHIFESSARKNDFPELISFLKHPGIELVGFNNIRFDAQITESLLRGELEFAFMSGLEIAESMYALAQEVINLPEGEYPRYAERDFSQPQVDLFKIHHFDNKARRTSLKSLQVNMKWHNVQDMPYHHTQTLTDSQIEETIGYCRNDVLSTREFYLASSSELEMRTALTQQYRIPFTNQPDSSIGEKLFLELISKKSGIKKGVLKEMRTWRSAIPVKDLILPTIQYQTEELQTLLDWYRNQIVYETRDSLTTSAIIGNVDAEYGTGGVHACAPPGIYEADDVTIIHDIDVTSFYPNIAIANKFRPEHLGDSFNKVYEEIFQQRAKIPKKDPRNKAFKLMLNSVFGKSNSMYSFLYDPAFTLKITVNGQLLISQLAESLTLLPVDVEIIQINTDGLTVRYPKIGAPYIAKQMKDWETQTGLSLESAYYKKFVVRDVNSYMAIYEDGTFKTKGVFVDKPEWHQNPSFRVLALAAQQYFLNGTLPEDFIAKHDHMWDFLGRQRFTTHGKGMITELDGDQVKSVDTGRTVRYYMSTTGSALSKFILLKGETPRFSILHDGHPVTVVNKYNGELLHNIERNWYVLEAWKIIEACGVPRFEQLNLF